MPIDSSSKNGTYSIREALKSRYSKVVSRIANSKGSMTTVTVTRDRLRPNWTGMHCVDDYDPNEFMSCAVETTNTDDVFVDKPTGDRTHDKVDIMTTGLGGLW